MEDVVKIASYIADRYQSEFGTMIDEMKLHKLLYFTQRESIIQTGAPMFQTLFEAWKYGPVLVEIRPYYKSDSLHETLPITFVQSYKSVFDKVFKNRIFARSKRNLAPGADDLFRARVQDNIRKPDFVRRLPKAGSSHHHMNAGDHLLNFKRLCDIIVRAGVQAV